MRNSAVDYPNLHHLIGGYFHQDWSSDGETDGEVVRFYCRMEKRESLQGAVADIDRLLRMAESEDRLLQILRQLGCAYRVTSARDWLQQVRTWIEDSLRRKG